MRRFLILSWILMGVLILSVQSYAQVSLSTVLFLRIAAGARAAGMGECFVAVADDATATHWNPAGLGLYPLASGWVEYEGKGNYQFKSLALLKNDRPESNYEKYDLWAISGVDIYSWNGKDWQDYLSYSVSSGETQESIVRKYTQEQDEERLKKMLDRVTLEKGTAKLPYNLIIMDTLNCISSDEKNLWIGANDGLYQFDGQVWKRFSTGDGLPTNKILSLSLTPTGTIWAGTDSGVVKFDGKVFIRMFLAPEVKDQAVIQIAAKSDDEVWAATRKELLKLDNNLFLPYYTTKMDSFEALKQEMKTYLDREDSTKLEMVFKRVEDVSYVVRNQLSQQSLKIEYNLALEGEITCLAFDRRRNLLVGTKAGFLKFEDGKWKRYGYRKFEVKGEKTVEEVAAKFLPYSKDQERIGALTDKIVEYNHLSSRELEPGQVLYVYANSLGSKILSIAMAGENKLFVGTEFGTLRYDGESWGRYYHSGLERNKTHTIICQDKDIFFGTEDKAVVYAHARRELTFMHAALVPTLAEDVYYEYLSYVQNTENWGTLGGSVTFISYGSIITTNETGIETGEINPYEFAVGLSYGTKMGEKLTVGLGAKFIYSLLSSVGAGKEKGSGNGSSFAVDAGLLYKTPFKRLTLGVAVTNLGPNVTYIDADQSDPLPRNLALGFAYKIFDTPYNKLTAVGELNKELVDVSGGLGTIMEQAVKNMGVEYWYGNYVALRAGYIYDKIGDIKTATFGAGLRISLLNVDFAYIPASENVALANTTRISGTIRF